MGLSSSTLIINPLKDYKIKGSIKCGCFSSKCFYYWGNNKLLIGESDIYITDIKDLNLEYIINIGRVKYLAF